MQVQPLTFFLFAPPIAPLLPAATMLWHLVSIVSIAVPAVRGMYLQKRIKDKKQIQPSLSSYSSDGIPLTKRKEYQPPEQMPVLYHQIYISTMDQE